MLRLYERPSDHFWQNFWLFELAIFLVVGVICWLIGLQSISDYGFGLMAAGILLIIIAGAAQPDIPSRMHETEYQFGMPLIDHSIDEQLIQKSTSHPWQLSDLMQDVLVGAVPLIVGLLLSVIF